ncbi:protein-tyrosine phosphatase-like protein [Ephemerocybe angulata]|uniref:Protein-tyrosine phosphatase-like protein n=1 Tax=Ephemerocybe angulata TaxID=980116 RepID=A0A8H6I8Z7_9AGAR|nr:protein-tyrosine phosphatase-like protein [Tulosesus angulatus]
MQTAWVSSAQTAHSVAEHLADQLRAAMDEPLTAQSPLVRMKTSMSHPINISCLLPIELVSMVLDQAMLAGPPSPVLLQVPDACIAKPGYLPPPNDSEVPPLPSLPITLSHNPPELNTALEAAISATLPSVGSTEEPTAIPRRPSISLSLSIEIPNDGQSPLTMQSSIQLLPLPGQNTKVTPGSFSLGNLYMSSCPGKKVRLNGPINGRSSVCRDLGMDMARMKALGVGCVVCCLDDEELELLGAPWPAYQQSAQTLGIDILRIPIPEGLPPITPAYIDSHLEKLLKDFTLKGKPVLVHCRGGVGRAGVVACCWLIRLGLCGWIPEDTPEDIFGASQEECHSPEVVKLVETAISFVRERRNAKAVETYEQVQFLVEYVEYLQGKALNL